MPRKKKEHELVNAHLYKLSDEELDAAFATGDTKTRRTIARVRNLRKDPDFYNPKKAEERRGEAPVKMGSTSDAAARLMQGLYKSK